MTSGKTDANAAAPRRGASAGVASVSMGLGSSAVSWLREVRRGGGGTAALGLSPPVDGRGKIRGVGAMPWGSSDAHWAAAASDARLTEDDARPSRLALPLLPPPAPPPKNGLSCSGLPSGSSRNVGTATGAPSMAVARAVLKAARTVSRLASAW